MQIFLKTLTTSSRSRLSHWTHRQYEGTDSREGRHPPVPATPRLRLHAA
uniref:Uncharacterized protein n=1 Tax=Arundo donax TaxID=35708 RepID=A0A0A9AU01_ARUDO